MVISGQGVYGGFGFFLFYEHDGPVVVFYEVFVLDDFAVEVDMGDPVLLVPGAGEDSRTGYALVVYIL